MKQLGLVRGEATVPAPAARKPKLANAPPDVYTIVADELGFVVRYRDRTVGYSQDRNELENFLKRLA